MTETMKVLMISTDRGILDQDSKVFSRMLDYAELFTELHIIVFAVGEFKKIVSGSLYIYPTNAKYKIGAPLRAVSIARKIGPMDVVTTQDPFETGLVGYLVKGKARLNIQIHTDIGSRFFRRFWLNKVRLLVGNFLLPRADSIRVVSWRICSYLENRYSLRAPVTVLPIYTSLVESEKYSALQRQSGQINLLTVSRLEPEKNVDVLIRATALLGDNVQLHIVGSGGGKEELAALATSLGIAHRVVFHGQQKNVAPFFNSADIYVQSSFYEGFGLTLLEAAMAGLPIVSTDVGLIGKELPIEAVIVAQARDVKSFVVAIKKLVEDSGLRQENGEKLKQSAIAMRISYQDYLGAYRENLI